MSQAAAASPIQNDKDLDEALSRPIDADVEAMGSLEGDILFLGVSGKMGPTMASLAKRASEAAGVKRKIIGAARFSAPGSRESLEALGVETVYCDLLDRASVDALPDAKNVMFMAGQKFGTSSNQSVTWANNAYAPAIAAERFKDSRIVAFSTGNVYPLTPVASGGPTEKDPVGPIGEYAQSALGRERIFEYFSQKNGTPAAIIRLNYAVELRYGVLRDVADRVAKGEPIDIAMGYANVIWQRDANSIALRAFGHTASPPFVLNMTGADTISIREVAEKFGELLGKKPVYNGTESDTALLNNAALCKEMFGPATATVDEVIGWIAAWISGGGRALGKPTHFEQRDGNF